MKSNKTSFQSSECRVDCGRPAAAAICEDSELHGGERVRERGTICAVSLINKTARCSENTTEYPVNTSVDCLT
jgi:hypothetical protein